MLKASRTLSATTLLAVLLASGHALAKAPPAKPKADVPKPAATAQDAAFLLKPPPMTARERDYRAKLDKILAPVLAHQLSGSDAASIRDAFAATGKAQAEKAAAIENGIKDPVARTLVRWHRLRNGDGDAATIKAFLAANPDWPDQGSLKLRLEAEMFSRGGAASAIKSHFAKNEPMTGVGLAALASAHLAEGDQVRAKELAVKAWREKEIPASLEPGFLARFGSMLSEADHKARVDYLLTGDARSTISSSDRVAMARRVLPLLGAGERPKAQARLDWGPVHKRVQTLRRQKNRDEAVKLLLTVPTGPDGAANADAFWDERRSLAFALIDAGNPKLAYQLVREGGGLSVNPAKEQAFTAGWIALRFLKDREAAARHFAAMAKVADGPLSRAKAAYWQGRAAEAQGNEATAREHYKVATGEADTFHGLLARQKLDTGPQRLDIPPPAAPTEAEIARFTSSDVAKAVVVAHKAKLTPGIARTLLHHLRTVLDSDAETAMGAHLADALGETQTSLRIAKAAVARGQNLLYYSYPYEPFPAYAPLRKPPETAMLLGVARQESEFHTQTVSTAGAKGLLQVMGITARHVCRDYKIKCELGRLLDDKPYNTMLASAYIGDRMGEFSGSYVLTLAGYNAGPGRAREWIKARGDPRDPSVDPIDWIERIPFQETREYVSKVLSNIQVYRARIAEDDLALRLEDDLLRGRPNRKLPAAASAN